LTKALVHGLVFIIVYHFTHKLVWKTLYGMKEGAIGSNNPKANAKINKWLKKTFNIG